MLSVKEPGNPGLGCGVIELCGTSYDPASAQILQAIRNYIQTGNYGMKYGRGRHPGLCIAVTANGEGTRGLEGAGFTLATPFTNHVHSETAQALYFLVMAHKVWGPVSEELYDANQVATAAKLAAPKKGGVISSGA